MFRLKVALAASVVLLITTLAAYFTATERIGRASDESTKAGLQRAASMYAYVSRAEAYDFTRLAEALLARTNQGAIADAFDPAIADDPTAAKEERDRRFRERNKRTFIALQVRNAELSAESRKADLLVVTDAVGKVIARDVNENEMVGDDLKGRFATVGRALQGQAVKDVWSWNGSMMRVAVAPVKLQNKVVGAFAVGFVVTAADAQQKKREVLGVDLAYMLDGKIHAASFTGPDGKGDPSKAQALSSQVFEGATKWGQQAIDGQKATEVFAVVLGSERYLAIAAPMAGNSDTKKAGVVIVSSLAQPAGMGGVIIALGLVGILIVMISVMLTARQLIRPAEEIEKGVSEVINGNLEYTFPQVSRDFEGLANALNVMLCRLTGRPEPNEEGDDEDTPQGAEGRWRGDPLFVEELGAAEVEKVHEAQAAGTVSAADAELAKLVEEPELVYLQRTFHEFVAAKQAQGQAVETMTLDGFVGKLRQNEASLKDKYHCKAVRFRVVVKGAQVTLKPVPIY
ncbi:MAG TPA: MXAN_5187 C-terminal domain-containing protein [Polyangia bacterium]|jgi:HAMP domain-containing protein